jgi:hypothetical protein
MIEPNCDMPWEIYLDWLTDQGNDDLRGIDLHAVFVNVSFYDSSVRPRHNSIFFGSGCNSGFATIGHGDTYIGGFYDLTVGCDVIECSEWHGNPFEISGIRGDGSWQYGDNQYGHGNTVGYAA